MKRVFAEKEKYVWKGHGSKKKTFLIYSKVFVLFSKFAVSVNLREHIVLILHIDNPLFNLQCTVFLRLNHCNN